MVIQLSVFVFLPSEPRLALYQIREAYLHHSLLDNADMPPVVRLSRFSVRDDEGAT